MLMKGNKVKSRECISIGISVTVVYSLIQPVSISKSTFLMPKTAVMP